MVAILLAAGESTRMGKPKQLLPWAGTTLIAWQVNQMKAAGAGEVVVVVGAAAHLVQPAGQKLASDGLALVHEDAAYRVYRLTKGPEGR